MSKITVDRKVLEQSLAALTASNDLLGTMYLKMDAIFALKAELAQPERTDGMPASADERYLRRLLAVRVGIPGAYYDDGEAHGAQHGISIDFMRDPVADIDAKLRALNVARAEVTQPEQEQEPVAWIRKRDNRLAVNDGGIFDGDWTPLYTHPPRREWQGLTEEEIKTVVKASEASRAYNARWRVTRAEGEEP